MFESLGVRVAVPQIKARFLNVSGVLPVPMISVKRVICPLFKLLAYATPK